MLGNAFQVTWVKIHFLIVASFHTLQVLYSPAKAVPVALYSAEGKGTARPMLTCGLQHAKRIITVCDEIINPDNF